MRLIAGLGNPGAEYESTRHNLGFEVCECFARRRAWNYWKAGFRGLHAQGRFGGEDVVLLKPQTYMNLSGRSVQSAMANWKLAPAEVLVVADDMALPLGKLRVRERGSAGGHNGLQSVIEVAGEELARLRLGIGDPKGDPAEWVLKAFLKSERDEAAIMVEKAADALETILVEGVTAAMNRFNG